MGSAPKVLIADDSPLVLRMIEKLLGAAGFATVTASDGLEAVEKALTQAVDMVVLDVSMPRMNGYQACRLLKSEPATRDLPVVILTSKDQAGDRFWGIETGADYYLTKDSEPQRIVELVKNVLSGERPPRPAGGEPTRGGVSSDVLSRVNELLDRQLYEATILSEIGQVARSVAELDETFTSVMALVTRVADFSVGALAFVESDELEVLIAIQRPVAQPVVNEAKARLLEAIGRERAGAPFQRVRARLFRPKGGQAGPEETTLGGFVALPILTGAKLSGLLALAGKSLGRHTADLAFLEKVAHQAHIVIENSRLVQRLQHMAVHDGLTELFNHRHTQELLKHECERVGRYAGGLSLLMIDIDHFKEVNDRHGHPAGDQVLREVARVLKAGVRTVDSLGRYGGEEFVAILPQTEIEDARMLADRLRQAVEALSVKGPGGDDIHVTISVGVARYPSANVTTPDDLVREADQALYRAKQAGRNRVA